MNIEVEIDVGTGEIIWYLEEEELKNYEPQTKIKIDHIFVTKVPPINLLIGGTFEKGIALFDYEILMIIFITLV